MPQVKGLKQTNEDTIKSVAAVPYNIESKYENKKGFSISSLNQNVKRSTDELRSTVCTV